MDLSQYIKEAFSAYDHQNEGHIMTQMVKNVLADLGYVLKEEELSKILRELDTDGVTKYEAFLHYCTENPPHILEDDELINALKVFDQYDYSQFKEYLMKLSNKLSKEEIEFLDQHVLTKQKPGKIDVKYLFNTFKIQ